MSEDASKSVFIGSIGRCMTWGAAGSVESGITVAEGPRVSNRGWGNEEEDDEEEEEEEEGARTSPGVVTFKYTFVAAAAPLLETMNTVGYGEEGGRE